jgi:beta-lactamase class D
MKQVIMFLFCLVLSYPMRAETGTSPFLAQYIKENNITGTVVIESLKTNKTYIYNDKRSKERFLPASTFKIVNTLIALQEKAVRDENEIIQWDGKDKGIPDWNKNQNMKIAFPVSCVWFYQELAKKVGNGKYLSYLKKMNYGNMKTGKDVDSFWLDGDLRISALEQIDVLRNIYGETYAFDRTYYATLKTLMIVDKNDSYIIRAKTGTTARVSPNIGWYVGYIETKDDVWFFACNMELRNPEQSKLKIEMTYQALKELHIIKK